jgi:peptide alpha-N-acetyltransferase
MSNIICKPYVGEADLPHIMALVQNELSEPYVVYTFRYFLYQWPHLAFLAYSEESPEPIGVIVCKQSMHRDLRNRGYIAMLSVSKQHRKRGIASALVKHSVEAMKEDGVEEIVLETEYDNAAALSLYESLGFIREKRLHRFYLNGKDAFRLVLSVPLDYDDGDTSSTLSTSPSSTPSLLSGSPPPRSSRAPTHLSTRAICVSPYSDDEDEDEVSMR